MHYGQDVCILQSVISSPKNIRQYCANWYWGSWSMLKVVRWM